MEETVVGAANEEIQTVACPGDGADLSDDDTAQGLPARHRRTPSSTIPPLMPDSAICSLSEEIESVWSPRDSLDFPVNNATEVLLESLAVYSSRRTSICKAQINLLSHLPSTIERRAPATTVPLVVDVIVGASDEKVEPAICPGNCGYPAVYTSPQRLPSRPLSIGGLLPLVPNSVVSASNEDVGTTGPPRNDGGSLYGIISNSNCIESSIKHSPSKVPPKLCQELTCRGLMLVVTSRSTMASVAVSTGAEEATKATTRWTRRW